MKVGYIGIGHMGRPMAGNLLKAGHSLYIHNRTLSKCESLAAQGATVCPSPAEVAVSAEVVFINVPDTPDVEQVIFGPDGIGQIPDAGLIVVDNSTISPSATRQFARRLKEKGVEYLDAPVSGGEVGAQKGTLAIMVGGDEQVFKKCLPLLEILGSKIVRVGPVGAGQATKARNQLFVALHVLACCEGIALAKRAGLDPAVMVNVVSSGAGGSWALANLGPKIIANDFKPGFTIDLFCKDLRLVTELAQEAGLSLSGIELAQGLFNKAQTKGLGRLATLALSRVVAEPDKLDT
ncbi:MAG: NAD(P)-dependent oxidoreductase [Phycisphaerales bacterium]|nr:MAG: NAD(P)-dependent oxidoreductase [Phycisphaerales bacterium]